MEERDIVGNDMPQRKSFFNIFEHIRIYLLMIPQPHRYYLQPCTHPQAIAFCQEILLRLQQWLLLDCIEHMVALRL
jgi:hypothetical protein